jgi:hypothetical protein
VINSATAARAAIFDASSQLTNSAAVDTTELEYLDGVTSALQTQLDGKQATLSFTGTGHTVRSNAPVVSQLTMIDGATNSYLPTNTIMRVGPGGIITTGIIGSGLSLAADGTLSATGGGGGGSMTNAQIFVTFDGGGAALATNLLTYVRAVNTFTITGWEITADASGSCVVDVWKDTYANFPPTIADTIAGSELPTLAGAQKNTDTTLSTWTTTVTKGDWLGVLVQQATTVKRVHVAVFGY